MIRLKSNRKLTHLAEELVYYDDNHPWMRKETYYHSVSYQAGSCLNLVEYVFVQLEAGELLLSHVYYYSFSENIVPKEF